MSTHRITRRRLLQAGTLGTLGFGLPQFLAARALANDSAGPGFGRAKACIFIFAWGGPSQLDTFDLKPDAPAEVRGEFKPIPTSVPGLQFCEHFGQLAQRADRMALIRSLHHDDPAHLSSGHLTVTGHLAPIVKSDQDPPSGSDTPQIGSVIAKLRPNSGGLPTSVMMPWKVFHPAAPGGQAPGQHGGWLGKAYDPFLVTGDPSQPNWAVSELSLPEGMSPQRLENRRDLLAAIDRGRARLDGAAGAALTEFQQQAFGMLSSGATRHAFDLGQEPDAVRDRYGRNIHGQCVLLARRLAEHGVPLITVNWHNDGRNFWDTHGDNFNRLKNDLIPPTDQALSALLDDLAERDMLDETIVAWVGEFGRNPKITAANAGREHWPYCYSGLLAGGGIRGGTVYGASDAQAAYPHEFPVPPQDYVATLYHALGISPETMLPDPLGRPLRFCTGEPLLPLFG